MDQKFMQMAIDLALNGIRHQGHGPFGAVIVKDNEVVGRGTNQVTSTIDPTAHAEVVAIRDACRTLGLFSLSGCEIYTSCEPCPMCLGAIYWARLDRIYFGATRNDAARVNFDDHHFYEEMRLAPKDRAVPMLNLMQPECQKIFAAWESLATKIHY
jgi:guanine deaminase